MYNPLLIQRDLAFDSIAAYVRFGLKDGVVPRLTIHHQFLDQNSSKAAIKRMVGAEWGARHMLLRQRPLPCCVHRIYDTRKSKRTGIRCAQLGPGRGVRKGESVGRVVAEMIGPGCY